MSRQLEAGVEAQAERQVKALVEAVYGGLIAAVSHAGGDLTGLSVRWDGEGVLLVLKAVFPGGAMVGFIGGENLASGLTKAAREARTDMVRWRPDKWAKGG